MGAKKTPKTDRRIVRTRKAIREAMLTLLATIPYSKITITALAAEANVDRKTFYAHYASVDDLFEDVIRTQLEKALEPINFRDFFRHPSLHIKHVLTAVETGTPFTHEQIRSISANFPTDLILRCWTNVLKERLSHELSYRTPETEESINVLVDFYLGGIFNAYISWLKADNGLALEATTELLSTAAATGLEGAFKQYLISE